MRKIGGQMYEMKKDLVRNTHIMSMKRANIKSVAEAAGVSLATVSRVINGSANVSEDKIQCVYRAASGLGYRIPQRSVLPAHFRTRNIALAYSGWSNMQLAEWGFMEGIEDVFRKNDLRLVLTCLPSDGQLPSLLADRACDGVIVVANPEGVPENLLKNVKEFPCIQIIRSGGPQDFGDEVLCDNATIARMAIDYLYKAGARKFAYVNFHPDHEACRERGEYFDFFLRQRKLQTTLLVSDMQDALTRPRHLLAEELADRYLDLKEKPDGLFIPVDFQLPEIYTALQERGIKPMEDVQIISCDNCERHLARIAPRPATIDQCMYEVGYHAARQLIWRIQHPDSAPIRLFIKPELILPPAR